MPLLPDLRIGLLASAVLCAGAARPARAQVPAPARPPLVTDRPDFTEAPNVVEPRRVQLEAGNTYARSGDATSTALGEMLLRIGVIPGAELRVALNSYVHARPTAGAAPGARATGWEDPSLGAKFSFVEEAQGRVPSVSLLVGTTLPTGSEAFGRTAAEPEAKVLLAWEVGERWALSSNLNYTLLAEAGGRRVSEPSASLSLGRTLTSSVGSYLEVFAFRPSGREGTQFVNGGLTVLLNADLQLDARAGSGFGRNGRDFFVGLGLARRW